ncbi:UDP-N-acetylmuramoylalanyl-D-glutamate--2,6-diaminopimelate ligase [hydrothermal vent metagenome]|uniref:UDP-N-acetylmuramoylalanyl-D-glutamate--2,6-diaminopimelate ligase n=1 Tax=hydrothermal vent metagenome TaxID=652676 RepID=A0A160TPD7_9ZZZZ
MNPAEKQTDGFQLTALLEGFAESKALEAIKGLGVTDLCIASQQVTPGSLFMASRGQTRHGLDFMGEAIARGATAIVWESDSSRHPVAEVPLVKIDDLSEKLGDIAARFFADPSAAMTITSITGTNGKTSVAHFIAQALDRPDARCGLIGTLGAGLYGSMQPTANTTPNAVDLQRAMAEFHNAGAKNVVMEASSHGLEQGRVNGVKVDTAVFANLSRDHLDYHGDMESYAACKQKLFSFPGLKAAVINADDAVGNVLIDTLPAELRKVAFSLQGPVSGVETLSVRNIEKLAGGLRFKVEGPWGEGIIETALLGAFNAQNLLASLAVLLLADMPMSEAVTRLSSVMPVPGRMERFGGGDHPVVVVDYAHTPDAMEKALLALRTHTSGKLVCVFGCGGDRDWGKRPQMGEVVERHTDFAIITDDNPRNEDATAIVSQIRTGLQRPRKMPVIHDRLSAIEMALEVAGPGDCVLIAGKGHEEYQIIEDKRIAFSDRQVIRDWLKGVQL